MWLFAQEPQRGQRSALALNYDSRLGVPSKPLDSMLGVGREVPAKDKSNN